MYEQLYVPCISLNFHITEYFENAFLKFKIAPFQYLGKSQSIVQFWLLLNKPIWLCHLDCYLLML